MPTRNPCVFTSQVILMIRTYAIWDRHKAVFLVFYRDCDHLFYTGGSWRWFTTQDDSMWVACHP